tara:strand:- start:40 stop:216 length:177 start_codon:yes stop_codon:yes gene_type:complete
MPININGTTKGVKKNKFRIFFPIKFEFTSEYEQKKASVVATSDTVTDTNKLFVKPSIY